MYVTLNAIPWRINMNFNETYLIQLPRRNGEVKAD
jgi:hypothetical protein